MTEEKPPGQLFEAPPPGYNEVAEAQQAYPMENYPSGYQEKPGYPDHLQAQGYPPQPYPPQNYPPQDPQPPGYHQPFYPPQNYPPQGYTQQTSQNNVVVVSQPPVAPTTVHVQQPSRANDFLACTVVLMAMCCLHGNLLSVVLLVPALLCALVANQSKTAGGQDDTVKTCGCLALSCNITVVVLYALEVITAIAIVIAIYTGAFSSGYYGGCTRRYTCGYFGFGGSYTCTYRCTYY